MNTNLRNLIGYMVVITLIGALILGAMFTRAYDRSSSPSNFRSFTVVGDGKAVGVPDVAEFSFDVITEGGTDIAATQSKNAEKMNAALAYVGSQGVNKKDITTTQYSIQPQYESIACVYGSGKPCPPARIVAYTIQQSAHIKVRDFKTISTLLSGVVTSGANTVSSLSFSIDDATAVENEAREKAIEKAQEKAEAIADAAGFDLGRLIEISENVASPYNPPVMYDRLNEAKADGGAMPTIEAGSQEVNVNVVLKYEID